MRHCLRAGYVGAMALLGGAATTVLTRPAPVAAERAAGHDAAPEVVGRVGYVHLGRVLCESNRGRAHHQLLGAVRAEQGEKADALRHDLERAETAAKAALSAEARVSLEAKAAEARDAVESAEAEGRREFEAKADKLVAEMYQEVAMAAAAMAREYGLDAVQTYPIAPGTIDVRQMKGLIETPGALLYVKRDAELTDEVIRRLDARFAE